jgi:hypothetical protein
MSGEDGAVYTDNRGVPYIVGGNFRLYLERPYGNKKIGELERGYDFKVLGNKLNGLHYIDGLVKDRFEDGYAIIEYKQRIDTVAMIGGHTIYTSSGNPYTFGLDYNIYYNEIKKMYSYFTGDDEEVTGRPTDYPPISVTKIPSDEIIYDLEAMVSIFLDDLTSHLEHFRYLLNLWEPNNPKLPEYLNRISSIEKKYNGTDNIYCTFEELESGTIAVSYGIDNDNSIILKVNPNTWLSTNLTNKWYILYHELGHDVLNQRHGQGGRMMFNYPTKEYTWEEFFDDRQAMFVHFIKKNIYPDYDKLMTAF